MLRQWAWLGKADDPQLRSEIGDYASFKDHIGRPYLGSYRPNKRLNVGFCRDPTAQVRMGTTGSGRVLPEAERRIVGQCCRSHSFPGTTDCAETGHT